MSQSPMVSRDAERQRSEARRPPTRSAPLALRVAANLLFLFGSSAFAGGLTPAEALSRMRVPDGLEVRLVACEPLIRQPVSMSFDSRGRLWVLQYLQYPTPAGLTPVSVDQFLRTKYDRLPEPPPRGPKGADKLTILSDPDEKGQFRKSKDFITGLNLATGFALGHGGVFVVQAPYLLFYPDRNGDDVPDGDPEVLLTGFGMEDSHALANSLVWGPDGWLYGAQGSTVTANIRGIEFQQGIWRYHPRTKEFELFSEGGGNTWGLDFDRHGQIIAGTNFGGVACLHQVQGGYYVKNFGKHGELHNPHTFGFIDHIPCDGFKGGHVTCGGIVYRGGLLPGFNDRYIAANLLSNVVNWYELERARSTYKSRHGGAFLQGNDPWFRPIDCLTGPDGAVYIADWYDQRANHVDPVDNWDKSNGRIYKVVPKGHRESVHPFVATSPRVPLESLWATATAGEFREADSSHWLESPDEDVRAWAVRLLGDAKSVKPETRDRLVALARSDPSLTVRSQLACTAKRLPANDALPIVADLLRHANDAGDPHIPLLLWWAVEDKAIANRNQSAQIVIDALKSPNALAEFVLERLARRFAAENSAEGWNSVSQLLRTVPADCRNRVLIGVNEALIGRSLTTTPLQLVDAIRTLEPKPPLLQSLPFRVRIGQGAAVDESLKIARDNSRPERDRIEAITAISESRRSDGQAALLTVFRDSPEAVRLAILSTTGGASIAELLEYWPRLSDRIRAKLIAVLAGRKADALALLRAVEAGRIEPKVVPLDQLRRIAEFHDAELDRTIAKHWGRVAPPSSGEKLAHIRHLAARLGEGRGNPVCGRVLFRQHCATCHALFGEGEKIGPDLTSVDRKSREWLLTHIVDPSAVIRPEFAAYNVLLHDGRSLIGLIADPTPQQISLIEAKGDKTRIDRARIQSMDPASSSLMPEKLIDEFDPQQLRDFFSYLQGDAPPPLPIIPLRSRILVPVAAGQTKLKPITEATSFDPSRTAVIVCDMWDKHWSRGATMRVDEMAPRVNELLKSLRAAGATIVHAPSDTMAFYADHPARKNVLAAATALLPPTKPHDDPNLPIDDSGGGSDTGETEQKRVWNRQHPAIEIDSLRDGVADDLAGVWNFLQSKRVERVFILGVHTNMCVLNRSFGIKSLVRRGVPVALVRDLTDSLYNPARSPHVKHAEGTRLVVEFIERFWCPTVDGAELLGAIRGSPIPSAK